MSIKEIYQTMEYGPAPESNKESVAFLDQHKRKFQLFINGKWSKPSSGEYFDSISPSCIKCFTKLFLNKNKKFKYISFLINLLFDFGNIYGIILSIKDGVAKVIGLKGVKSGEMVYLGLINYYSSSPNGMVLILNKGYLSVACFDGGVSLLKCGDRVFRTFRLISIPFSLSLFGRTSDPLGSPLDGKNGIQSKIFLEIDTKAIGIIPRESVKEPMQTGVLAVDALTPIGCGQRELIIGDRCEENEYKRL